MESAITLIADGCLYYRGQDAVALSEDHGLEQVAELIWTGSMTEGTDQELPRLFEVPAEIGSYGVPSTRFEADKQWSPALAFGIALQRAATGDPAAYDLRTAGVTRTGARILRLMVTAVTARVLHQDETVASTLQRTWIPEDPRGAPLLNRALVLCADHELNVSSFTARCVASAGATPYAVVVAGLAALSGAKHGGDTERVEAFLAESEAAGGAREAIASRLRRGEAVPGFGHPLYPPTVAREARRCSQPRLLRTPIRTTSYWPMKPWRPRAI